MSASVSTVVTEAWSVENYQPPGSRMNSGSDALRIFAFLTPLKEGSIGGLKMEYAFTVTPPHNSTRYAASAYQIFAGIGCGSVIRWIEGYYPNLIRS